MRTGMGQRPTLIFKTPADVLALGMLESRAKELSQVSCVSEDLEC